MCPTCGRIAHSKAESKSLPFRQHDGSIYISYLCLYIYISISISINLSIYIHPTCSRIAHSRSETKPLPVRQHDGSICIYINIHIHTYIYIHIYKHKYLHIHTYIYVPHLQPHRSFEIRVQALATPAARLCGAHGAGPPSPRRCASRSVGWWQ